MINRALLVKKAVGIPINIVLPTISGTAHVGNTLASSPGTWTNIPTSYAFQWQRPVTILWTAAGPVTDSERTGQQIRQIFAVASLASPGITVGFIRVKFTFNTGTSAANIVAAYVGNQGAGNPVDFDGSQVQLLFGGSVSLSGLGVGTVTSDLIALTRDWTKPLVVAVYITGTSCRPIYSNTGSHVGNIFYRNSSLIDPSVTTPTYPGVWTGSADASEFVAEVAFSGPIPGATASSYAPVAGDVGFKLASSVIATNFGSSSASATSASTAAVT
jgi:hypothetical protein